MSKAKTPAFKFKRPAAIKTRLDMVLKAVDIERGKMGRAITLLQCLAIALEHGEDFHSGPCYDEVAQLAVEMLAKSMDALDAINLPGARP
jgi:hypothetical protein